MFLCSEEDRGQPSKQPNEQKIGVICPRQEQNCLLPENWRCLRRTRQRFLWSITKNLSEASRRETFFEGDIIGAVQVGYVSRHSVRNYFWTLRGIASQQSLRRAVGSVEVGMWKSRLRKIREEPPSSREQVPLALQYLHSVSRRSRCSDRRGRHPSGAWSKMHMRRVQQNRYSLRPRDLHAEDGDQTLCGDGESAMVKTSPKVKENWSVETDQRAVLMILDALYVISYSIAYQFIRTTLKKAGLVWISLHFLKSCLIGLQAR